MAAAAMRRLWAALLAGVSDLHCSSACASAALTAAFTSADSAGPGKSEAAATERWTAAQQCSGRNRQGQDSHREAKGSTTPAAPATARVTRMRGAG